MTTEHKCSSFPMKLRDMLEEAVDLGLEHVVSWEMDGRAFKVHKPNEFVELIMPKYFNQTKYKSFQRQLNLYGFNRIARGPRKGCYLHELFQRNNGALAQQITRKKAEDDQDVEVDLAPTWLPPSMVVEPTPLQDQSCTPPTSDVMIDAFETFFQKHVKGVPSSSDDDMLKKGSHSAMNTASPGSVDTALERMLDNIMGPDAQSNSASSSLSHHVLSEDDSSIDQSIKKIQVKRYQRTAQFPDKLHDMLDYCEVNALEHVASWQMQGRAFKVHSIDLFMKLIMPKFFKQTKFESLQRQLNLYCFARIAKGPMKGCYHHSLFLKGGRSLSKDMTRRKPDVVESATSMPPLKKVKRSSSLPISAASGVVVPTSPNLEMSEENKLANLVGQMPGAPASFASTVKCLPPTMLEPALVEPDPLMSRTPNSFPSSMMANTQATATSNDMWAFGFVPSSFQ